MIYEFKASHCFRTFVYFFAENYSFVGFFLKLKERKFFFSVALFFFVNGLFFLWTRTGERKSTCLRALFESIFKEEFLLSYRSYLFNFLFLFAIVWDLIRFPSLAAYLLADTDLFSLIFFYFSCKSRSSITGCFGFLIFFFSYFFSY